VPLAERASVLPDLSRWVLRTAIRQLGEWQRAGIAAEIAVNLSAADFADGELPSRVLGLLRDFQAPPQKLLLEVTESAIMRDPQVAAQVMQQLRLAGVRFAIDDFGTGHSSLATLRRLPAQELKIDRAFVADMASDADARAIVEAVVTMARTLGLRVVAEGVETPAQRDLLVQMGCDELQGYLFAKPMSARAIALWAMDAPTSLAQTFRPSLFKDTQITGSAPTEFLQR
jgi:EAL domain-containing protein (putative c-di-GMP-specific phosphodiesterase class I)